MYISVCVYLYMYVYVYIEREIERERDRQTESTNKTNRREVWFDFHTRYRDENIAKSLPTFSKS